MLPLFSDFYVVKPARKKIFIIINIIIIITIIVIIMTIIVIIITIIVI